MFSGKRNRGRRNMVPENKILLNLDVKEDRILCMKRASETYFDTDLL